MSQQQESVKIQILVKQPQVIQTDPIKFVTYQITGIDKNGQFNIRRRYKQFDLLREALVQRWPGLYIPPISSKKITGNTDQKFVECRRKFLSYFCQKIAERDFIFYGQVFQSFLRATDPDYEKSLKNLPKFSYVPLLQIYQSQFGALASEHNAAQLQVATQTQFDFLKKAQKKLEKLRQQFQEVAESKREYMNQFNHCMEKVFPEYEQKYLLEHVGQDKSKMIIVGNQSFDEKFKAYKQISIYNPMEIYFQMVQYELKEVRALIQAVKSKQQAESKRVRLQSKRREGKEQLDKLKSGKTTFKSIFTSGSKEVQIKELEESIPRYQMEEESLSKMVGFMNIAIYKEIKQYKEKRGKQYTQMVKQAARMEMKELSLYGQLMAVTYEASKA